MIRVEVGDIASQDVDAIVRPATESLGSVAPQARDTEAPYHVRQPLDVGAAVVTAGTGVSAEFIIHAVIRTPTKPVTVDGVRLALSSVLHQVRAWRLPRLAIPILGAGAEGIPLDQAANLLAQVLSTEGRTAAEPQEVCIVVGSEDERSLMEAHLRSWLAHES